jgi:hypothetical protein
MKDEMEATGGSYDKNISSSVGNLHEKTNFKVEVDIVGHVKLVSGKYCLRL